VLGSCLLKKVGNAREQPGQPRYYSSAQGRILECEVVAFQQLNRRSRSHRAEVANFFRATEIKNMHLCLQVREAKHQTKPCSFARAATRDARLTRAVRQFRQILPNLTVQPTISD